MSVSTSLIVPVRGARTGKGGWQTRVRAQTGARAGGPETRAQGREFPEFGAGRATAVSTRAALAAEAGILIATVVVEVLAEVRAGRLVVAIAPAAAATSSATAATTATALAATATAATAATTAAAESTSGRAK